MYGDWDHATEIRDNLSAHMEANREYFAGFAVAQGEKDDQRELQLYHEEYTLRWQVHRPHRPK